MTDTNLSNATNNQNTIPNVKIFYYTNNVGGLFFVQAKGDIGEKGDTGFVYDWMGTLAEYTTGRGSGEITDEMVCYITDDAGFEFDAGFGINIADNIISVDKAELSLNNVDNTSDINKPVSTPVQNALNLKVDKVSGKDLTTNDLTNNLKTSYDSAVANSHTHSNKTALDNVSGVNTGDQDLSGHATITALNNGLAVKPTISTGTTVPATTPSKIGDQYTNTSKGHLYNSKGTSSSADWVKLNGSEIISLTPYIHANVSNSLSYFYGGLYLSGTVGGTRRFTIPRTCVITSLYGTFYQMTTGTNEAASLYIRVNNTTDYLVANNLDHSQSYTQITNTSLNIPMNAGDYFEVKWVTPAWTSKPTNITPGFRIGIDY